MCWSAENRQNLSLRLEKQGNLDSQGSAARMGKEAGWSLSTEGRAGLREMVQVLLALMGVLESPENSYGNY